MAIDIVTQDCLEWLRGRDAESVDCIVTSPPYNIGVKYSTYKDERSDYYLFMEETLQELFRVTTLGGSLFLQVGGIPKDHRLPHTLLSLAQRNGWILQNEIIWVKSITVEDETSGQFKPINSKRCLNHTHEYRFHLTKTGDVTLDRLAVGVPYQDKTNMGRWGKPDKRCGGSCWFIPYKTVQSKSEKFNHPAGFPVELPLRCLKLAGLKAGQVVLDPFSGAGTTMVAADILGLDGVGVDLDPQYSKIALERLEAL